MVARTSCFVFRKGTLMRKEFFEAARRCAEQSDYNGASSAKIGAVAVFRRTIIARGHNQNKTHPLQQRYNIYRYDVNGDHYYPSKMHAEIELISKIRYLDINFSEVEIYVYRETKDGRKALARPCKACTQALKDLGIKKIYYTTNDGFCEEQYR